jgi:hypothetical protein
VTLRKREVLEVERGIIRWLSRKNSLWKKLRTCRNTDYVVMTVMMMMMMMMMNNEVSLK